MRSYKKYQSRPMALGLGFIICLVSYIAATLITCLFMLLSKNPTGSIGLFSLIALLIGGVISGFILRKTVANESFALSLISPVIFGFILLSLSLIFGGNALSVVMNILCYLAVSALISYLSGMKPKRKKRRKRA